MAFHVAVRILSSSNLCVSYNHYAEELLKHFVTNFKVIYGVEYVSHNIHGCLHIAKEVLKFGPFDGYGAFNFENFLQKFTKFVRKGDRPLQQIVKRYSELEAVGGKKKNMLAARRDKFLHEHNNGPLLDGFSCLQYKMYKLESAVINVGSEADCCVGLTDGSVVLAKNFAYHTVSGEIKLIGFKYKYKEDLYNSPCSSSLLNVFKVHGLSSLRFWSIDKIAFKFFRVPFKDKFAVLPLLHQEKSKY